MKLILRTLLVALAALTIASTAFGQTDVPGSKDYPGISRMPGFYIKVFKEAQFDSYDFSVQEAGKEKKQPVEGHWYKYEYKSGPNTAPTSVLQIIRNFQNAARAAGGQVLGEFPSSPELYTTLRLVKGGNEVWVEVDAGGPWYTLNIIERQLMKQDVIMDAAGMANSLANTGSVAIYGINFDTAKSEIKPESKPAIDEIAKLLTNNPALKVGIVGHTDMVGDATSNMKLSQARAQSVINELVTKHGIAAARLVAFGAGPWAPLASNKTDEGRAKNRRVELVEIATK
ncbi:MAG: OmpA family protein [Terracidiphilus sp.]|jgi:outer membrane protein OmpA-like peptidoglycan-associated protein